MARPSIAGKAWGRLPRWLIPFKSWHGGALLMLVVAAVFAPLLAPYDPVQSFPADSLLPPSSRHLFGTDSFGFDVLSRVMFATRTDLTIALLSVSLGVIVGVPLGVMAGYAGAIIDDIIMRFVEMVQAFPQILFAMIVFAAVGNEPPVLVAILAFLNAVFYARLVRAVALPLREAEFVLAARLMGHRAPFIVFRHLVPNVLVPVFAQFAISSAFSVMLIAGLSFVGLGVRVPQPEWGSMIQIGADYMIYGKWWPSVFPGLAVFLTTWSLIGIGERLQREYL